MLEFLKDYRVIILIIVLICILIFIGQDDPLDGDYNFEISPAAIGNGMMKINNKIVGLFSSARSSGPSSSEGYRNYVDEEAAANYSDETEGNDSKKLFEMTYGNGADASILGQAHANFVKNSKFKPGYLKMKQQMHAGIVEPAHPNMFGFKGSINQDQLANTNILAKPIEKPNTATFSAS